MSSSDITRYILNCDESNVLFTHLVFHPTRSSTIQSADPEHPKKEINMN